MTTPKDTAKKPPNTLPTDALSGLPIPQSKEAEDALLSSLLINPEELAQVDTRLKSPEDFYYVGNKLIYTAMLRLKHRGDEIDMITIGEELSNMGELEKLGGTPYLYKLLEVTGTGIYATVYADLIKRAADRRRMIAAADQMRLLAFDEKQDIDTVRSQADRAWMAATSEITSSHGAWISEVISELYEDIENAMRYQKTISGISSGLKNVDSLTNGFGDGQLIILAGRPGMGKSAALDNIALHIARDLQIPVFYATSERARKEVVLRMAAIESQVDSIKLSTGRVSPQEAARFTACVGRISEYPIFFDDNPMPRPQDVYAQADWMIKRNGCKIILFDGMYRAKTGDPVIDRDPNAKYSQIVLDLKTMARSLNVPVLTTHQLNRSLEQRQDKRPVMSDLRESGRIEEEADKILFLYRDEIYNEATESPNVCDWIMAKHRNGRTGTASTYYEKSLTKFSDGSVNRVDLSNLE